MLRKMAFYISSVEAIVILAWGLFFFGKFIGSKSDRTALNASNIILFLAIAVWLFSAAKGTIVNKSWGWSSLIFFQVLFIPVGYYLFSYSDYKVLGLVVMLIAVVDLGFILYQNISSKN